jgi:hypothetical protein
MQYKIQYKIKLEEIAIVENNTWKPLRIIIVIIIIINVVLGR